MPDPADTAAGSSSSSNVTVQSGNASVGSGAGDNAAAQNTSNARQTPPKLLYSVNKQPNELRGYATFNSIVTLSCLTPSEINFPDQSYRRSPPSVTVLRSGGGAGNKARTAYETADAQIEYFIDNIEIDSVIVPTNKTRTSNANVISFEVHEPYSMGLFLQTLQVAARNAGHANYNRAPYMLSIEFIGYDDKGNPVPNSKTVRHLPIKISNVEFDVTAGGSRYTVKAYAWNEQAQSNTVQTVNVETKITGNNLVELLQKGPDSLTGIINKRNRERAEKNESFTKDEYIIIFPTELVSGLGLANVASGGQESGATATPEEIYTRITGIPSSEADPEEIERVNEVAAPYINLQASDNNISAAVRALVADDATINSIGKANVARSMAEGGSVPFGVPAFTQKENDDGTIFFDNGRIQISNEFRTFQFPQGTNIEKIIEELVILSTYGQQAATQREEDNNGNIPWFRVQTQCYIVPDAEMLRKTGENPKVYVYMIVPYSVHSSVFQSPTRPSVGVEERKLVAAKEYNYIYTGQNEDIIDFEITINNAFYSSIAPDGGLANASVVQQQNSGTNDSGQNSGYVANEGADATSVPSGTNAARESNEANGSAQEGGGDYSNTAIQVARQFNEAIVNSDVDLLSMELTILGDPYYIADSGVGNYSSPSAGSGTTEDGTIDHQRGEVDIVLNFRTPIDYSQSKGTMIFPGDTVPVKAFSGLYRVNLVKNRIEGNKFSQILSVVRRPNQEAEVGQPGTAGDGSALQSAPKQDTSLGDGRSGVIAT